MGKFFHWETGRQQSGYKKMLLVEWKNSILPFDAYLLHYPTGSEIATHSDPVRGWRHIRINIVLKQARRGGVFSCTGRIFGRQRVNVFYSDMPHEVSRITEGTRTLLSVGVLIRQPRNTATTNKTGAEQVILVSAKDEPLGAMEKLEAHEKARLHRAFSIVVRNSEGKLLLQRRATTKYHSAGLWTNTCCGHPREHEDTLSAAHRRLKEEMGFDCPLTEAFVFHYGVPLDHGLTEHEIDHVFVGTWEGSVHANPDEASEVAWRSREDIERDIAKNPEEHTYWFKLLLEKAKSGGYF